MNTQKQKLESLNKYLTDYVKEKGAFNLSMKNIFNDVIKENKIVNFSSDWNYLMSLVEIIEDNEPVKEMICDRNYFKIHAINDESSVQDKGYNKIDVIFRVCIQFLSKSWKPAPYHTRTIEPFDKQDLL